MFFHLLCAAYRMLRKKCRLSRDYNGGQARPLNDEAPNDRAPNGEARKLDAAIFGGFVLGLALLAPVAGPTRSEGAQGDWEITPQSEQALQRGLKWLAHNQGPEGNWQANDLGLVSTGVLAFLAAGHLPQRGPYGQEVHRALDYVLRNVEPSGLMNQAAASGKPVAARRAMYNHGLSTFVLGQAYGASGDPRIGPVLDRALKLIARTQCKDGGWDYEAVSKPKGHDLSLVVMQAKALRSAVDSGLEVPPEVVEMAIRSVRQHYTPNGCSHEAPEEQQRNFPGKFTYEKGRDRGSSAMAAAGVVCLQEFGQYDDWRIEKSMNVVCNAIRKEATLGKVRHTHKAPFGDAYALYYVSQALYQVGGPQWEQYYPRLRDTLVASQVRDPDNPTNDGKWAAGKFVSGKPGELYMTAVACFVLAIPNRYLPILQEGNIESLRTRFGQ